MRFVIHSLIIDMQDRHTVCRCTPVIDSQQDWYLLNGQEEGGYTILEFTRNFTTCDDNDLVIKVCRFSSFIILSWLTSLYNIL